MTKWVLQPAADLAQAMLYSIAKMDFRNIQYSNEGKISWYDFA
jgi:dTDP-4-dehydrorhamnose reductase